MSAAGCPVCGAPRQAAREAPADGLLVVDDVLEQHAQQQAPLAEAGPPPHLCATQLRLSNRFDTGFPLRPRATGARSPRNRCSAHAAAGAQRGACTPLRPPAHARFSPPPVRKAAVSAGVCRRRWGSASVHGAPAPQSRRPLSPGTACCPGRSMGSALCWPDGWQGSTPRLRSHPSPPLRMQANCMWRSQRNSRVCLSGLIAGAAPSSSGTDMLGTRSEKQTHADAQARSAPSAAVARMLYTSIFC